jgi:hypothetical protein
MNEKAIGFLQRLHLEADEVAKYLEGVAKEVRAGRLIGFDLKWLAGGEELESKLLPLKPLEEIPEIFDRKGDHEDYGDVRRDADRPGRVSRRK